MRERGCERERVREREGERERGRESPMLVLGGCEFLCARYPCTQTEKGSRQNPPPEVDDIHADNAPGSGDGFLISEAPLYFYARGTLMFSHKRITMMF
jgi:hypothetical protein